MDHRESVTSGVVVFFLLGAASRSFVVHLIGKDIKFILLRFKFVSMSSYSVERT